MTWSRMQSKITILMLGLALIGGTLLPLTAQPVRAAESSAVSMEGTSTKGIRRPPCARPNGTQGPCRK
jgi:hypothetical protein